MPYNVTRSCMGFGPFRSMEENGEVYGKDLVDGFYHSRFGYEVMVIDGEIYKIKPNGDLLQIHPSDYSVFIKGRIAP